MMAAPQPINMGDVIEKTVRNYDPFKYYKVAGFGMWFDLKTRHRGQVGLSPTNTKIVTWIEFHSPGLISIMDRHGKRLSQVAVPFSLSDEKFTRFWVSWNKNKVWAGVGNKVLEKLVSAPIPFEIKHFTFSTKDRVNPCTIQFAAPPLALMTPPPNRPNITKGKLEWRLCSDQLPDDTVIGGNMDGEYIYIIRAHHRNSLTPGVYIPSHGLAFIAWGGSDNPTTDFEALCGYNLEWVPARKQKIPATAFVAGYSEIEHELLYIGRAWYCGNLIPGKVQMSHYVCYVPYKGKEVAVDEFEVLTEPNADPYCVDKYVGPSQIMPYVDVGDHEDIDSEYVYEEFSFGELQ